MSRDEVNDMMRHAALNGELVNQIHYQIDPELVSSDIIGDTCCSVFDSNATNRDPDGKNVVCTPGTTMSSATRSRCPPGQACGQGAPPDLLLSRPALPPAKPRHKRGFVRDGPRSMGLHPYLRCCRKHTPLPWKPVGMAAQKACTHGLASAAPDAGVELSAPPARGSLYAIHLAQLQEPTPRWVHHGPPRAPRCFRHQRSRW